MGRSGDSFGKKEREKKRLKKRKEKEKRREERRSSPESGGSDSMIAYVDEFGNITDTPPDPASKKKISAEDIVLGVPKREEPDPVHTGQVAFFNDEKGYGFIKETGTQEKFFVHISGLLEEVFENDRVTFELERGLKGMNAVKVKKIKN